MSAFEIVCDSGDREAWLRARNTGIGASEIAVLLGASDWGSNLEMYYRKVGEIAESLVEQTEAMQWGLLLEAAIRDELARRAEVQLLDAPARMLRSIAHPWATATPDAITVDGEPVEVKNLTHGYDPEAWAEQIPEKYMLQCQHQMLVTGAKRCLFGALLWGSRLVWEWVPRDETRIRAILKAGSEFWGHVERRDPPESDGNPQARKALAKLATDEEPVELYESEIAHQLERFRMAKELHELAAGEEKRTRRKLDAAKDELAKQLGTHRCGTTATGWSIRWKTIERRGYTVAPTIVNQLEIQEPKE